MWTGFVMFGISDLLSALGVLVFARALAATETGWRSRAAQLDRRPAFRGSRVVVI